MVVLYVRFRACHTSLYSGHGRDAFPNPVMFERNLIRLLCYIAQSDESEEP